MNSFMIKDAQGNGIALSELNKEIATFWGKEVEDGRYVHPYAPSVPEDDSIQARMRADADDTNNCISLNWKQFLGWNIANLDPHTSGWSAVAEQLMRDVFAYSLMKVEDDGKITLPQLEVTDIRSGEDKGVTVKSNDYRLYFLAEGIKKYKPFIDLINYFKEKGYVPVQIIE